MTSRTAQRQAQFLAAIEHGHTRTSAAALVGVRRETAWRWMQSQAFGDKIAQAEGAFVERMLQTIDRALAGRDGGKLAIDMLGRRTPGWQPKSQLSVEGIDELTPEERSIVTAVRRREGMDADELDAEESEFVTLAIDGCDSGDRLRAWRERIDSRLRLPAFTHARADAATT